MKDLSSSLFQTTSQIWHHSGKEKMQIALPGGQTPKEFYSLVGKKCKKWDHLSIMPTDERWVDIDSDESNEKMIKKFLLANATSHENYISLKTDHKDPFLAEKSLNSYLKKTPELDFTLLGMGNDGHIASLFRDSPEFNQATNLNNPNKVIASLPSSKSTARISLTMKYIIGSKKIVLLLRGQKKMDAFLSFADSSENNEVAIAKLLKVYGKKIEVFWSRS